MLRQLHISFIVYPKEANRMQARFAVDGAFHVEPLNYMLSRPAREKAWLVCRKQAPKNKSTLKRRFKDLKSLEGTYTCKAVAYEARQKIHVHRGVTQWGK